MGEPPPGTEVTQMGYIFDPESIGIAVRYCARKSGKPVFVTENGIGTMDDSRRREYIQRAVREVHTCIQEGVHVLGYCYWSIIDNFECSLATAQSLGWWSVTGLRSSV